MQKSSGIVIDTVVITDTGVNIVLDNFMYNGEWNVEIKRTSSNNIIHSQEVIKEQEDYSFNNLISEEWYELYFTKDGNIDAGMDFKTNIIFSEFPPSIGEIQVWNNNNSISLLIELIDSSSSTTALAICLSISFINVSDLTPLALAVCKNCKSLA